ncbi:hypothetical protein DYBT9275_00934 [Dyadobacter sp. CECT 9275]|uniref:Uncharacterized protein n=1 Tax=Dyadobacter helix TaxID=2822344 RepID=A0A916JCM8_9BACT|nr:hypothetical protein [Dyadobacter sp. CECT 9275]CAG4992301.1 hypothetical protein DYBT9275_00934 [Dyadobacter sp. CECT 9275]
MKSRRSFEPNRKQGLSPERAALQKQMASCFMILKFHDGNTWGKWSNEHAQPNKIMTISDGINEMLRVFEKYFRGSTFSGAIFDTRQHKKLGAFNKIYQFEKGVWTMVQPFEW